MNKNRPLLLADRYWLNDNIAIRLPTIGEILEFGEADFFSAMYNLCAVPYDLMAQLAEVGIDYENITEFQLFWYGFLSMTDEQAAMLFCDGLNPRDFQIVKDEVRGGEKLLRNDGVCIDAGVQEDISDFLRHIHMLKKTTKKAGNSAAKRFLLDRAKKRLAKAREEVSEPYLESLVIKIVNAPECSYTFETCLNMNIYAFNASVQQIQKRVDYDLLMGGVYAGTVDGSKINLEKVHWLSTNN